MPPVPERMFPVASVTLAAGPYQSPGGRTCFRTRADRNTAPVLIRHMRCPENLRTCLSARPGLYWQRRQRWIPPRPPADPGLVARLPDRAHRSSSDDTPSFRAPPSGDMPCPVHVGTDGTGQAAAGSARQHSSLRAPAHARRLRPAPHSREHLQSHGKGSHQCGQTGSV